MQRSRYIDLMEKILSAYTNEHIEQYYNEVKNNGLQEHGFPRLTANIGILIAHGKRTDLKEQFVRMMDLCCQEIPLRKYAGNDFSIKEVVFVLLELEKHQTFPAEQIERWKAALKNVTVENCYKVYAAAPDSNVNNWAAFTMVSEWMRYYIKVPKKILTLSTVRRRRNGSLSMKTACTATLMNRWSMIWSPGDCLPCCFTSAIAENTLKDGMMPSSVPDCSL